MNPIFKNISAQETEKYLKNTKAKTLNYKKDAFIFFEGDTPAFIFVLKSGIVQIEKNTADGSICSVGFGYLRLLMPCN